MDSEESPWSELGDDNGLSSSAYFAMSLVSLGWSSSSCSFSTSSVAGSSLDTSTSPATTSNDPTISIRKSTVQHGTSGTFFMRPMDGADIDWLPLDLLHHILFYLLLIILLFLICSSVRRIKAIDRAFTNGKDRGLTAMIVNTLITKKLLITVVR